MVCVTMMDSFMPCLNAASMPRRGCDRLARYLRQTLLFLGLALSIGYVHAQSSAVRERWYWYDKRISQTERHIRLSYQPLSRRWRVMQSAQPIQSSGLGVSLGSSYDSLKDALQAIQKINRWKMAELSVLNTDAKQKLDIQFNLDLSQLPQALQFGNLVTNDWALELRQSQRLDDLGK